MPQWHPRPLLLAGLAPCLPPSVCRAPLLPLTHLLRILRPAQSWGAGGWIGSLAGGFGCGWLREGADFLL